MHLRKDISVEKVGDQWLVVSHRDNTAHHLGGPAATVMGCVTEGQAIPPEHDDTVSVLVELGILEPATGWSRRQVLTSAASAATVGIISVTLPTAALASSVGHTPDPGPVVDPNLGKTWTPISVLSEPWPWYSVAFGKVGDGSGNLVDGWVAINEHSNTDAITSIDDGETWSQQTISGSGSWRSVAHGITADEAGWVAVGENKVMTSGDGISWASRTTVTHFPNRGWRSVAYGKIDLGAGLQNGWVAVATNNDDDGGKAMYSADGLDWTASTSAVLEERNDWRSVATDGNGVWVAVNSGAFSGTTRVMRSTNGKDWAPITAGVDDKQWHSVAYGDGLWVAVGFAGAIMTSPDGATWTRRADVASRNWYSVAFGDGVWVAVASGTSGTATRAMRSTNGIDWTDEGVDGVEANTWRSVAYGNGVFVAVNSNGTNRVMRSPAITP